MRSMRVTTPQQRLAARQLGERRAAMSLVQLLCAVSILRTALTQVVPLAGSAAWWVTAVCLLPGLAAFLLAVAGLRMTGAPTLTELARRCLGQAGARLVCWVLGAALLVDAMSSLTALVTLFTEGVGTRGTQLTLALLTSGALLCCLHRQGLPRGVYLLRWVLLAGAVTAAAVQAPGLRPERLHPILGDGPGAVGKALQAGVSMAWPLLLLLTLPGQKGSLRLQGVWPVALGVTAALLLPCLSLPHEALTGDGSLAGSLLRPALYASPALRLTISCLLMLGFFLAIAGAVQTSAELLCAPVGRMPEWLPWALLAALTISQALDVRVLWRALMVVSPWLLLPLAALMAACLCILVIRRDRP